MRGIMSTMQQEDNGRLYRRRGRPSAPIALRRRHEIKVRLNDAERAELGRRATTAGMAEIGTYLRRAVLAQRPPRAVVPEVNRGAWGELARTTANLNQIAAHLNGGGRFDERGTPRLAQALDALRAEVRALRLTLTEPTGSDGDEDEDEGDEA